MLKRLIEVFLLVERAMKISIEQLTDSWRTFQCVQRTKEHKSRKLWSEAFVDFHAHTMSRLIELLNLEWFTRDWV